MKIPPEEIRKISRRKFQNFPQNFFEFSAENFSLSRKKEKTPAEEISICSAEKMEFSREKSCVELKFIIHLDKKEVS